MSKYALILLFLLFTKVGYSQTNSLTGKWKIVMVDNGEVSYNFKTDSISILSDDLKQMYKDESKIAVLKQNVKMLYGNSVFEFSKGELLKMELMSGFVIDAKYKNDVKRNVIIVNSKNSLNEIVVDELPYTLKEDKLYLNLNFTETPASLILEKTE
ncbi:hypothetical protein ACX0HA_03150 [Flavobacterium hauense]